MNRSRKGMAQGYFFLPGIAYSTEKQCRQLFINSHFKASRKHKCFMKSVFKLNYLPAFALVLAGGMAVATTNRSMAPQYFKDSAGEWQPLGSRQIALTRSIQL